MMMMMMMIFIYLFIYIIIIIFLFTLFIPTYNQARRKPVNMGEGGGGANRYFNWIRGHVVPEHFQN